MSGWSDAQVEMWRGRQRAYEQDKITLEHDRAIDGRRLHAQHEMLQVLKSFQTEAISLKEFNATFQQRTHDTWGAFHLRGMSGGLFFNKLVIYIPNQETFPNFLRLMLFVPTTAGDAQLRMQAFVRLLEGWISSQQVRRALLQPARIPFFISVWWHIQAQEQWPIFYCDIRRALLNNDERRSASPDPVGSYLAFRTHFLGLAQALGVSSWELEHLCMWSLRQNIDSSAIKHERQTSDSRRADKQTASMGEAGLLANRAEIKGRQLPHAKEKERAVACREHMQWLLAKLGRKVGCCAWIATGDRDKVYKGERLGDLSLSLLPILSDSAFQKAIGKIDVLWFAGKEVIAAFEIEQARTDVSISLLRLSDLKELFPDRRMNLCLVVSHERFEKVQFELSRPAFQARDLQKHCALICEELLLEQGEHILRWATSPAIIEGLIGRGDSRKQ